MYNITKIDGGFIFNSTEYIFDEFRTRNAISQSQAHVYTSNGVLLLDLSCTIESTSFTDINSFLTNLYI